MRFHNSILSAVGLVGSTVAVTIDMEGLADTGLDTSSWTKGTLPPIADSVDLNDLQIAAKNTLADKDYAYYRTAALDETTYKANMFNWQKIRLNGFSFTDVSDVNLNTSILGYQFSSPFFIAPAAQAGRASSGAESNLAKAAGAAGILYVPSISSTQSISTIADAAVDGQVMFHQEYIWSDETRLQTELDEMKSNGFKAIFLTVDNTGVNGIRDRQMRFSAGGDAGHSATFTLQSLAKLQAMTTLPIVPKGVKTAHDVKLVADLGLPAVYISNHGGRVVDGAPTAAEILLDVHRLYPEVFGQIEIYCDGGVRRATHVLTLVALGCRAVGLGRPAMYANVYGEAGVTKMINILTTELTTTMALMGEADISAWHGNTTYINTKQLEVEFFGAPLGIDTNSSPYVIPVGSSASSTAKINISTNSASSSSTSSRAGSSSTSSHASTSTASAKASSSSASSKASSTASLSSSSKPSSASTSSRSATPSTTTTSSTASATASQAKLSCPASNNTLYKAASGRNFMIECNVDHVAGNLAVATVTSLEACIAACDSNSKCVDVSLSGVACYLKSTVGASLTGNGILGARLVV